MPSKAKKTPIQRTRLLLNALILILTTLASHHFFLEWQSRQATEKVIEACNLPELPGKIAVIEARKDNDHLVFTVIARAEDSAAFDSWMAKVDQWKKKPPFQVRTFSIHESEGSLRVDFSIQLREIKNEARP